MPTIIILDDDTPTLYNMLRENRKRMERKYKYSKYINRINELLDFSTLQVWPEIRTEFYPRLDLVAKYIRNYLLTHPVRVYKQSKKKIYTTTCFEFLREEVNPIIEFHMNYNIEPIFTIFSDLIDEIKYKEFIKIGKEYLVDQFPNMIEYFESNKLILFIMLIVNIDKILETNSNSNPNLIQFILEQIEGGCFLLDHNYPPTERNLLISYINQIIKFSTSTTVMNYYSENIVLEPYHDDMSMINNFTIQYLSNTKYHTKVKMKCRDKCFGNYNLISKYYPFISRLLTREHCVTDENIARRLIRLNPLFIHFISRNLISGKMISKCIERNPFDLGNYSTGEPKPYLNEELVDVISLRTEDLLKKYNLQSLLKYGLRIMNEDPLVGNPCYQTYLYSQLRKDDEQAINNVILLVSKFPKYLPCLMKWSSNAIFVWKALNNKKLQKYLTEKEHKRNAYWLNFELFYGYAMVFKGYSLPLPNDMAERKKYLLGCGIVVIDESITFSDSDCISLLLLTICPQIHQKKPEHNKPTLANSFMTILYNGFKLFSDDADVDIGSRGKSKYFLVELFQHIINLTTQDNRMALENCCKFAPDFIMKAIENGATNCAYELECFELLLMILSVDCVGQLNTEKIRNAIGTLVERNLKNTFSTMIYRMTPNTNTSLSSQCQLALRKGLINFFGLSIDVTDDELRFEIENYFVQKGHYYGESSIFEMMDKYPVYDDI